MKRNWEPIDENSAHKNARTEEEEEEDSRNVTASTTVQVVPEKSSPDPTSSHEPCEPLDRPSTSLAVVPQEDTPETSASTKTVTEPQRQPIHAIEWSVTDINDSSSTSDSEGENFLADVGALEHSTPLVKFSTNNKERNLAEERDRSQSIHPESNRHFDELERPPVDHNAGEFQYQPVPNEEINAWSSSDLFSKFIPVTTCEAEFKNTINGQPNFTKGCKWSPDGSCLLAASEDTTFRIFDLPKEVHCQDEWTSSQVVPDWEPSVRVKMGLRINDYSWYPHMVLGDRSSECFLCACYRLPVSLISSQTGEKICSYYAYDSADEHIYALSVAFSPDGSKIYCGYRNELRIFNTQVPGRKCVTLRKFKKSSKDDFNSANLRGRISCIAVNPSMPDMYAVGTYDQRAFGLFSEPDGKLLHCFEKCSGGITHIRFSPDGTKIYAGGRSPGEIVCRDIRKLGDDDDEKFVMRRTVTTQQRIYFDLTPDGTYLVTGSTNGDVLVYDTKKNFLRSSEETLVLPIAKHPSHLDAVNGLSIHPHYPIITTSSGQRHFPKLNEDSDDENGPLFLYGPDTYSTPSENSVKLWWVGKSNDM